jgi:cytochrome P450
MGTPSVEKTAGFHPTLSRWNPLAAEERADPYPTFALARREAPAFYSEFFQGWFVTGYDLILELLKDTERFSNRESIGSVEVPGTVRERLPNGYPWAYPSLENNDPPSHTRIRKLANQGFKPSAITATAPEVRAIADRLIDRFAAAGEVEFVSAFADKLPGLVMCHVLGVPDADADDVVRWSDDTLVMMDPNLEPEERARLAAGQADFYDFCERFIDERRERPRDDIMSRLVEARVEDEPALTDLELISTFSHFLIGGNETTRRLLGQMMLRLFEHPDQLEAIRRDPELAPRAVEETLRYASPVKGLFRTTTKEVELGGVPIPAGQVVVVMWAAANRDTAKFERPEEFDIFRQDGNRHLAFSRLAHFCIGAPLARLEGEVALQQLLARLPNLRRANDEPLEWLPLVLHHGLGRLNLAWDA